MSRPKAMSKAIIHQFDPQIYPRLLWIVIGEKKGSAISDRFDNIPDMDESTDADVNHAYDKISKRAGILIRFESKKAARDYSIVAHEASHAAMCIFSYIGAVPDVNNQEPFSYLVGWISGCVCEAARAD